MPGLAAIAGVEVRQSELSKIIAAVPRIDWLNEERLKFLIEELGPDSKKVLDTKILREVLQYILSGDRQAAVFLLCRTSHPNIREAIDYAMDVESKLRNVIERGIRFYNRIRSDQVESGVTS